MNTKSTELDPEFELKEDRQFMVELLVGVFLCFVTGIVISTALIFVCMSLID